MVLSATGLFEDSEYVEWSNQKDVVNLVRFVYSRCQQSQNIVQGSVLSHKNTSIVVLLEKVKIQSQGDKVGDLEL